MHAVLQITASGSHPTETRFGLSVLSLPSPWRLLATEQGAHSFFQDLYPKRICTLGGRICRVTNFGHMSTSVPMVGLILMAFSPKSHGAVPQGKRFRDSHVMLWSAVPMAVHLPRRESDSSGQGGSLSSSRLTLMVPRAEQGHIPACSEHVKFGQLDPNDLLMKNIFGVNLRFKLHSFGSIPLEQDLHRSKG